MSLSSDNSSDFHWVFPNENEPQSTTMYPPIKPLDGTWGKKEHRTPCVLGVYQIPKTPVYHIRIFSRSGVFKSKCEYASSPQEAVQLALAEE